MLQHFKARVNKIKIVFIPVARDAYDKVSEILSWCADKGYTSILETIMRSKTIRVSQEVYEALKGRKHISR